VEVSAGPAESAVDEDLEASQQTLFIVPRALDRLFAQTAVQFDWHI